MENHQMFCFQCEQTAGCTGCTGKAGVCGKSASVANLQDELTGALIGLARAIDGDTPSTEQTFRILIEALFATLTNVSFSEEAIRSLLEQVHAEKLALIPQCSTCANPCGRNTDYTMQQLWQADEDIRSLKSLILFGARGMAAYAYHAMVLGYMDSEVNHFLAKALFAVGEDWNMAELANNALGDTAGDIKEVNGVKYIATKVDGVDMNELRNLGDKLKGEIGSGVVVIVSAQGADKVSVIVMATDDVIAKGAHAGNLGIRQIVAIPRLAAVRLAAFGYGRILVFVDVIGVLVIFPSQVTVFSGALQLFVQKWVLPGNIQLAVSVNGQHQPGSTLDKVVTT